MLWFSLAVWSAFATALEAAVLKRHFNHLNSWEMSAIPFVWGSPFFAVAMLLGEAPEFQSGFWTTLLMVCPLVAVAFRFQSQAIRRSPISLTMPFLTLTPAIVMLTGFLVLGESIPLKGAAGIAAIVVGGYIINISDQTRSWLDPFKALATEPGTRYMLAAATIYSLCAVLGKKLLLLSSPLYAAGSFWIGSACAIVLGGILAGRFRPSSLTEKPVPALVAGLLGFTELTCHMFSISMTAAAYMVAVKRLNGLFSVLIGWRWLKEGNTLTRLAGAGLMGLGATLLAFLG
jgi:drug/metabolite transporter (DMT)-like permease